MTTSDFIKAAAEGIDRAHAKGTEKPCPDVPINGSERENKDIIGTEALSQSRPDSPDRLICEDDLPGSLCQDLACSPDILGEFARDLGGLIVGELANAKLIYLALTSRLFDQPVSVAIKSESASGKSFLAENVLKFFPSDAFKLFSSASAKALQYLEEPLKHRFLVVAEADGIDEQLEYTIRVLLSENRLRHLTVEVGRGRPKPLEIEQEGPTGLLVTTTRTKLHNENETRLICLEMDETEAQTRRILEHQAVRFAEGLELKSGVGIDFDVWQDFQRWLADQLTSVQVPFAGAVARAIPTNAVRARRDFPKVMQLVKAHALMHQHSRKTVGGMVVATLEDYRAVRDLMNPALSITMEVTAKPEVAAVVKAVEGIVSDGAEAATKADIAKRIGKHPKQTQRRIQEAVDHDYLERVGKGPATAYRLGTKLPENRDALPTVDQVRDAIETIGTDRDSEPVQINSLNSREKASIGTSGQGFQDIRGDVDGDAEERPRSWPSKTNWT